jgi:signal transduction histidine kinase
VVLTALGRWSLATRLRAAVVVLSLLLVAAGTALVLALHQADAALSAQAQRTFPARLAASQLLTSLVDQETGLRGYSLTGDTTFLEPYRRGLVAEQASRERLEQLVRREGPARLSLLTLDAAITAWRDRYATLRVAPVQAPGTDTTIQVGRQLFERVRTTSAELDAELTREIRDAQANADEDRRLVLVVLALMAVAVVGAVLAAQRALRSAVLRPLGGLAEQVAVVSRGEHSTAIQPSGPPDIREMGTGVEAMRLELVRALGEVERQQEGLELRAAELARSNADLEQFAYVASHDLQEPLRKISSFCQLLEARYAGHFDERGEQYLAFVMDGAKRMQQLISDLLMFSRVGRTSEGFVSVDLSTTIETAWRGLETRVEESGGALEIDATATRVVGDPTLLLLLLTNLFGNALKYRRPDQPPRIRVATSVEGDRLSVSVADNGIGIPPEYAEKVFVIFQRLHRREDYEGTGIGLALAKKVVEHHGGMIGLQPSPLGGACVCFTLPLELAPAHA